MGMFSFVKKLNPFKKGGALDKLTRKADKATGGILGKGWNLAEKTVGGLPIVGQAYGLAKGVGGMANSILGGGGIAPPPPLEMPSGVGGIAPIIGGGVPPARITSPYQNTTVAVKTREEESKDNTKLMGLAALAFKIFS